MKLLNISFDKSQCKISISSNNILESFEGSLIVSDLEIDCTYYEWNTVFSHGFDGWVVPFNQKIKNIILSRKDFSGFLIKIYNKDKRLLQIEEVIINKTPSKILTPSYFPEHDITGPSYADFFYGDLCDNIDFSGIVIDAGANVGFFTYLCKYKKSTRIYSIEPDPFPFYYLNKNFKDHPEVILIDKAVSDKNENLEFALNLEGSVGSAATKHITSNSKFSIVKETITIPDFLKIEGKLNLVKLDIEGSEFEVIANLLPEHFKKINQFFIEFHKDPKPIFNRLVEEGYQVEYRHSNENDIAGFIYAKKI